MKTAMRLCLAVQIGLAGVLMSEDAFDWIRSVRDPGIRHEQTAPAQPGDQTRPFTPVSVPVLKDPTKRLNAPVRLPEVLEHELRFNIQDTEEYGRIILVSGGINDQDGARFESFLRDVNPPAKFVALHSPGGAVHEALNIGRVIRKNGLNTMISADAACLSACPYILAGGVERIVSKSGWVGLHQHFHDRNSIIPSFLAVESVQTGHGETLEFLSDMEIDPLILLHVLKTPPEDIYLLVEQELTDYRLATEVVD
ncbi:MAG: hypothetical protein AAF557_05505 [Pseudomonadota bacterium]